MTDIRINIECKAYPSGIKQQYTVIDHFKLDLASNEFVCLVGSSGCGKTTLLNIIAGLDEHYQGQVSLGHHRQKPKIGYVFQDPRLLPWRTVRENIELVLEPKQSVVAINELLSSMQLMDRQHHYPGQLSLGMCRRVAIIRAFAVNPDILLMDEPFVSLDTPTARYIRHALIELWQHRPHTILFVTHDLREAIGLADRLVFLSASPLSIVSEITIPIPRDRRNDDRTIETFRHYLLDHHPEISHLL